MDVASHPNRCSPDSLSADSGREGDGRWVNGLPGELSEERRQKEVRGKQDAQKSTGRGKAPRGVGRYREHDTLCLRVEM